MAARGAYWDEALETAPWRKVEAWQAAGVPTPVIVPSSTSGGQLNEPAATARGRLGDFAATSTLGMNSRRYAGR